MTGLFDATTMFAQQWKRCRAALLGEATADAPPAQSSGGQPGDLQRRCLDTLSTAGWRAHPVSANGEQAICLMAEKASTSLLLHYSLRARPLSERALREVIAARARLQAVCAAVICPSGATREAKARAKAAGVLLLRASDLTRLDRAIGLR